VNTIRLAEKNS